VEKLLLIAHCFQLIAVLGEVMSNPVMLIILDGFGLAPAGPGNAVYLANTPNFDTYWKNYPHTQLEASGLAVGLPEGQMGNSEVGHMNIGAGRVVMQSLTYIQRVIDLGTFSKNPVLSKLYDSAKGHALHLMGLVSRGGVHSDLPHLFALLEMAKEKKVSPVYVHVFTDGRDTAPDSGLGYVAELEQKISELNHDIKIASVIGRYYAMDRDKRWDRVKQAYDAVICGISPLTASSATEAVQAAYARGETDEFIKATVITEDSKPVAQINDGDAVMFFNFRADRARQLTYALLGDSSWTHFERCKVPKIHYASLMEYDETLGQPFAFALPELTRPLAQVISEAGLRQYHTAETEKYPHVTYFFNAAIEEPFKGEDRAMTPSPKEVPTYDLKPQMSEPELTEATLKRIKEHDDDFLLLNFANPDMVGHTGVLQAADEGLGKLVKAIRAKGGTVVVIADHGNAETMLTEDGKPHTQHTTNPVPCIIVGDKDFKLRDGGVLGDVAPTLLELLGLNQPEEMTGKSLIER
jgi:2,3-bisphosphoglycerate-independent phosphoglycerate mutase